MDSHGEQAHHHYTKRVVLPSGKTIEVVYFRDGEGEPDGRLTGEHPPAETHQDLRVCVGCGSELVHPVQWDEAGADSWRVLLHCPNCHVYRAGVFAQDNVEEFDEQLELGAEALERDYKRFLRANMAGEIERFVGALRADAILPEDF